jgi:hypothetical protein
MKISGARRHKGEAVVGKELGTWDYRTLARMVPFSGYCLS